MREFYSQLYARNTVDQEQEIYLHAAGSLEPPPDLHADEWAENKLELSARVTKTPGLIRLRSYQREPVRSFQICKRTMLTWAAQVGKSIVQEVCIGHIVDQDPGPTMMTFPDKELCSRRSKIHLQPLFTDSPVLAQHLTGNRDDMQILSTKFDRMDFILAWAGSASQMASEPIRYLIRDEIAKYKGASEKEAGPLDLSARRTISYGFMARILDATTPTLPGEPGWTDLIEGTYEEFYVPCPKCGEMQVLRFKNFKYPPQKKGTKGTKKKKETPGETKGEYFTRVIKESYIECEKCKFHFNDNAKNLAVDRGEWRARNPTAQYRSFHLPSWYAPYVSIGEVAERWIKAQGKRNKLKDVINSDFAEPWLEDGQSTNTESILAHVADYDPRTIPTNNKVLCFLIVDVQKDYVWFDIWAAEGENVYNVDHGTMSDINDIEAMTQKKFYYQNGKEFYINHTLIDSGYRAGDVYEYVTTHQHCTALKGQESQTGPVNWTKISKYPGSKKDLPDVVNLLHVNDTYFSEELLLWFATGFNAEGEFNSEDSRLFLHNRTNEKYASHLTGRYVIEEIDKRGRVQRIWKDRRKRHDLFDTMVYFLAARYVYYQQLKELNQINSMEE